MNQYKDTATVVLRKKPEGASVAGEAAPRFRGDSFFTS